MAGGVRGKKARFAYKARRRRKANAWLRKITPLIAAELGCADRPWFTLVLRD